MYGQAEYLDYEAREGLKRIKDELEKKTKYKKSFSDAVKFLLFIERNCQCINKEEAKTQYKYF